MGIDNDKKFPKVMITGPGKKLSLSGAARKSEGNNWVFSDTLQGAHASSNIFSIIHTAKGNGLDPYWYLRYLFTKLPDAKTEENLRKLLPTKQDNEDCKRV